MLLCTAVLDVHQHHTLLVHLTACCCARVVGPKICFACCVDCLVSSKQKLHLQESAHHAGWRKCQSRAAQKCRRGNHMLSLLCRELGYEKQVLPKGPLRATRKRLRHPQASQELLAQVGSAGVRLHVCRAHKEVQCCQQRQGPASGWEWGASASWPAGGLSSSCRLLVAQSAPT